MSLEAESWERMGLRNEASPMELMINWLIFWGGREPTKTILTARRMTNRMGEMKRMILIFRGCFPFSYSGFQKFIIKKKSLSHNIKRLSAKFQADSFRVARFSSPAALTFFSPEL